MNILLWVAQVALALLCISGGAFQIFKLEELQKGVAAMRALPRGLWFFLGAVGCLAGLGLILPGATNLLTGLWDAHVSGAPVLAVTGQVPSSLIGRGAFHRASSSVSRAFALCRCASLTWP